MAAFQPPACQRPGPRQGRDMRLCVVTRQRLPKSLLWRVVRTRRADGKAAVRFDEGEGRSAYVSRDGGSVGEFVRRKRLGKALRHAVPADVCAEVERRVSEWGRLRPEERGLLYCEVYGEEGVSAAVEEVQLAGCLAADAELLEG